MSRIRQLVLLYGPWVGLTLLLSSLIRSQKTCEQTAHSVRHDLVQQQRDLSLLVQQHPVSYDEPESDQSWSPRSTAHTSAHDLPWWRPAT